MMIRFNNLAKWWAPMTVAPNGDGGASAASYGEDDLNSFAMAAVRIHRISTAYTQQIKEAKSEPEKADLEQRANGEMIKAVENEGLSVDTYQTIVSNLDFDADLADKVRHKIRKVA